MASRKLYVALATEIKKYRDSILSAEVHVGQYALETAVVDGVADSICSVLASDNPRGFDKERFMSACGVAE